MKAWRWIQDGGRWQLRDGRDRNRATIWRNDAKRFTWSTWNENGTGGENDEAPTLDEAKLLAVACLVRQGWAPGGWRIEWRAA